MKIQEEQNEFLLKIGDAFTRFKQLLEGNDILNSKSDPEKFSKLVKKLDRLEKSGFGLSEFEEKRRRPYKILSTERVIYSKICQDGINYIWLNKGMDDALRKKVDGLLKFSHEFGGKDDEKIDTYSGIPVKRAKYSFRNLSLKFR